MQVYKLNLMRTELTTHREGVRRRRNGVLFGPAEIAAATGDSGNECQRWCQYSCDFHTTEEVPDVCPRGARFDRMERTNCKECLSNDAKR